MVGTVGGVGAGSRDPCVASCDRGGRFAKKVHDELDVGRRWGSGVDD